MRLKLSIVIAGAVLLVLALFCWAYWPEDSYDYGYGAAYQSAWSTWMLKTPDPHVCDEMATTVLKVHPNYSPDRVRAGCVDGYRDGVNYRRVPLGLPQE